jgi:hypothetical protein
MFQVASMSVWSAVRRGSFSLSKASLSLTSPSAVRLPSVVSPLSE